MEAFMFSVNAVMPIVLLVVLGYILKRIGFMPPEFAKKANTIVFRVCLPAMLFLNVYKNDGIGSISMGYAAYAVVVVLAIGRQSMRNDMKRMM